MDDITAAFFQQLYEKIKQLEPSGKKEKLLVKALVISEMAGLGYSKEIVDKIVENRKQIEKKFTYNRAV
ncbi:hypothetical protein O163_10080 [Caldanaerobacter subterraneus subsp. yonseiensis KB-1]|uniref:Uncharacterized protein n=1 Tax=Caldanaerobacter subterraneus subsp. yonseiensis KB-1 TaxID=1388761 RepID=U5CTS0_CALSX|nr:hypothetical protein [Caldanaerobacter subterraneus]ERM91512.1 hypothetical protein O163_10080 [Caldanaerobacter subterraneus subsp. yonseiensis KB-1]